MATPAQPSSKNKAKLARNVKHYSIVPLHLISIHLAVYHLPGKILQRASTQEDSSREPLGTIECLVNRPLATLVAINSAILLIQMSFTFFLHQARISASSPAETSSRQKNSWLGCLANFSPSLKGNPKLSNLFKQSWLITKEAIIINLILITVMNILIVLVGSPTHTVDFAMKNLMLATLVSSLSFFPVSILLGWNQGRQKANWVRIFSAFQPLNGYEAALLYPAIGTGLGCWLGAIPIPLDWDRPWQTWPITCVIGAVTGHAVGSLAAIVWSELHY